MKSVDYLRLMGIDIWYERQQPLGVNSPAHVTTLPSKSTKATETADSTTAWNKLQQRVASCTHCALYKTRTQTVFGVGNQQADLLLIGEAPGAQEDRQGEPFVGKAGQLLTKILAAIQLKRDDIYITNILKSRPPNNRDPQTDEIAACTPFLLEQIALIQPKLIVALGRIAAHYLLDTKTTLGKLRGQVFYYSQHKIPMMATYHPAYLLRNPEDKRNAWQDWQKIKALLIQLTL